MTFQPYIEFNDRQHIFEWIKATPKWVNINLGFVILWIFRLNKKNKKSFFERNLTTQECVVLHHLPLAFHSNSKSKYWSKNEGKLTGRNRNFDTLFSAARVYIAEGNKVNRVYILLWSALSHTHCAKSNQRPFSIGQPWPT